MAWCVRPRTSGLVLLLALLSACNDEATDEPRGQPGVWAGVDRTCGQDAALEFRCWGIDGTPPAGSDATDAAAWAPRPVPGVRGVLQAAPGEDHTCVLDPDGRVRCWGADDVGQLGRGVAGPSSPRPAHVVGLTDVVEISGDGNFTCARHGYGGVSCWGANDGGQLGRGFTSAFEPTAAGIPGMLDAVKLSAGRSGACALGVTGVVRCWGRIVTGPDVSTTPTAVSGLPPDIVDVSATFANSCAITSDGAPYCWNSRHAIHGTPIVTSVQKVRVVAVDAGHQRSCGLDEAGRVHCWWIPNLASLGGPEVVPLPASATALAKGDYHGCALLVDDAIWCWRHHSDQPVRVRW